MSSGAVTSSRRFDSIVVGLGAMGSAGRQVFHILRRLRYELGVNSTCGASNISFGLPNRPTLNAAFLPMAIASGLTSAITSPLHEEMLNAVKAADVTWEHAHHRLVDADGRETDVRQLPLLGKRPR